MCSVECVTYTDPQYTFELELIGRALLFVCACWRRGQWTFTVHVSDTTALLMKLSGASCLNSGEIRRPESQDE